MSLYESILSEVFGKSTKLKGTSVISGGCINNAIKLMTSDGNFFLKWQTDIPEDMFQKEAEGLKLLSKSGNITTPEVIAIGNIEGKHYLLMTYIESASPKNDYWNHFGTALAEMHRNNTAEEYGLDYDNYIGKLPQPNNIKEVWIDFFIHSRLEFQLKLAVRNRMVDNKFIDRYRKFYEFLPDLLPVDQPALLHGDMWSGNVMVGSDGFVCLIDPAVYYGHREIELAFTQMFGGFDYGFYDAYASTYPLEPGFEERVGIYNIYPHMVHVNLFGQSYLNGVESVLRKYL
jgi:protein-ribulosamine 3-kinase